MTREDRLGEEKTKGRREDLNESPWKRSRVLFPLLSFGVLFPGFLAPTTYTNFDCQSFLTEVRRLLPSCLARWECREEVLYKAKAFSEASRRR